MTAVGVDWASGHWITAAITDEEVEIADHPSIFNVWQDHHGADEILVDIPIGLPGEDTDEEDLDDGRRLCDHKARGKLDSTISSSVFSVPCREAVEAPNYDCAAEKNDEILGRGLGAQSWSLVPRIREVDVFLRETEDARETIRESHPEVCFAALADDERSVEHRKSTEDGEEERLAILGNANEALVEAYEEVKETAEEDGAAWKHRITKTCLDDVIDALVLAHTASLAKSDREFLPFKRSQPPEDKMDLPMQILRPAG